MRTMAEQSGEEQGANTKWSKSPKIEYGKR